VVGSSLALVASGLALVFGVLDIVNFAPTFERTGTPSDSTRFIKAVHEDFRGLVSFSDPAMAGETLHFYLTGLGGVQPQPAGGQPPTSLSYADMRPLCWLTSPLAPIQTAAPVAFAGLAPGTVGIYQVDVTIPPTFPGSVTTIGCVDLVDRADIRVVQRGRSLGLPPEAAEGLSIMGEFVGQELQCDVAIQLEVFRLIHNAHAPAAELAQDAVMGNRLPDGLGWRGHCTDVSRERVASQMSMACSIRDSRAGRSHLRLRNTPSRSRSRKRNALSGPRTRGAGDRSCDSRLQPARAEVSFSRSVGATSISMLQPSRSARRSRKRKPAYR